MKVMEERRAVQDHTRGHVEHREAAGWSDGGRMSDLLGGAGWRISKRLSLLIFR